MNDKVVNKRQEVLDLYEAALASRSGEQMRTLNGICLASWTLRRMQENGQAFRKIAVLGIANKSLGVKELFNPGTTDFWCDPKVSEPYAIWMRQIAKQTVQAKV